jgi:hypothetical protein
MKATFIELPPFARHRSSYLDDEAFRGLQAMLMNNPEAGNVIQGTGGLRKVRFADARRGKGKRGGLRVIYYWWLDGAQFWLFTLYDKDEMSDLTPEQCKVFKQLLDAEIAARRQS